MIQCNNNPSRLNSTNILDVICTNNPDRVGDIVAEEALVNSDHLKLTFSYNLHKDNNCSKPKQQSTKIFFYKNANFDQINYHLSNANLYSIIEGNSSNLNLAWARWKKEVLRIVHRYTPCKVIRARNTAPWIDGEVIGLSHKKENTRKLAKRTNKPNDWAKYRSINNRLRSMVNRKHSEYLDTCFDDINQNPKKFWGLVSQKTKKGSIPHKVNLNGTDATDPIDKANLFNRYFYSQFNSDHLLPPNNFPSFTNDNLRYLNLAEADVLNVLIKLDINKAYGPDGLPPILYRYCADVIVSSLTLLFNLSLAQGIIPSEWKKANVVPVHKKGPKSEVANYRPISLLPIIGKILERCVHHHVFAITQPDIDCNQHGFVPMKSTSTQLVEFYNEIYRNIDNKIQCDVVYLDLSKAFDSVPHHLLLLKLQAFGISGSLLKWFTNYLSQRRQRVVIEGHSSNYLEVISGVPQGSILGPLLFLFYINDITECIGNSASLFMYADDSKISKCISSVNDCHSLQKSLDDITEWGRVWGMTFNPSKCFVMSFKNNRNKFEFEYLINNSVLNRVHSITDLGIIVSDDLKWENHINFIVNKANKRLGLVKRCIGYNCSVAVKLTCYKAIVRPLLESNSVTWFCNNKRLLTKIETVQRRATKYILNDYNSEYNDRLTLCNLLPLSLRRDFLDGVFLYNIINDLSLAKINVQFMVDTHRSRQNDDLMLVRYNSNTLCYDKFFTNRIVRIWNALPHDIRATDLTESGKNTSFKNLFKNWLFTYYNEHFNVWNTCTWHVYCGCTACKVV
jgi:hypothetical protein